MVNMHAKKLARRRVQPLRDDFFSKWAYGIVLYKGTAECSKELVTDSTERETVQGDRTNEKVALHGTNKYRKDVWGGKRSSPK